MGRCEFPQPRRSSRGGDQTGLARRSDRPCPEGGGKTDLARRFNRPPRILGGVVFEVVSREVSVLEVVLLVFVLESQQVVSLLGVRPLEFNTGMGGVVVLRRRGGTVHGLSSMVLVLLQVARGGFLGVVIEVVFVVVAMVGKMA
jgi:hypothetical protein